VPQKEECDDDRPDHTEREPEEIGHSGETGPEQRAPGRGEALAVQIALAEVERGERQALAEPGKQEGDAVAVPGRHHARDQDREHPSHVDPHVEQRIAAVPPRIVGAIEQPEQARDVGLEEAVADDQHGEASKEQRRVADGHEAVARRHRSCPEEDRQSKAEQAVGKHAAGDGRCVDEGGVAAVQEVRLGVRHRQLAGRVEDQQRHRRIKPVPLPELRHEEHVEALRLSALGRGQRPHSPSRSSECGS